MANILLKKNFEFEQSENVHLHSCGCIVKCMTNTLQGAGMAQWWEHSPPTNVAQVRFLDLALYVGWVCWFSTLHREVFSGYSGFPSPQKPTFDLLC